MPSEDIAAKTSEKTSQAAQNSLQPRKYAMHLLSAAACLSLAACGGDDQQTSSGPIAGGPGGGATPTPTPTMTATPTPTPTPSATPTTPANQLFALSFDAATRSPLETRLLDRNFGVMVPNSGPDGSTALRVTYTGNDVGSPRLTGRADLSKKVCAAMLQFDVKFNQDWIWVRTGKLHGVGPADPVTGGRPRTPTGWSSRTTFDENGTIATYLYDQDPVRTFGVTTRSQNPVFTRGQWHQVQLYTTLNGIGAADGSARVTVDGTEVVNATGVMFRAAGGEDSLIQQFMFSTFFGGNNPSFAPMDANGFATVTADFDNFEVYEIATQSSCQP